MALVAIQYYRLSGHEASVSMDKSCGLPLTMKRTTADILLFFRFALRCCSSAVSRNT